jgi:type I restriction enzyme S subunit
MSSSILKKFREFATINPGQSPKSEFYSKTKGTPFLQGNRTFGLLYPTIDTYTTSVTKLAAKGEILMSVRAPVGDLNYAKNEVCIGRGVASINAKDGDNKFLFYCLKYNIQNLIRQGSGTTYDAVNKDIVNDFELIMPKSKNERELIGKTLSDLDAKIEFNNKINQELEAMAKLLYDYWFVQFDFPDVNGKPYKSSGGKIVWNGELKREIPEGWKVKELGKILNTDLGGTPSTKIDKFWGGNIPWLNSGEIANFPIIEAEKLITYEAISKSATTLMPSGTCVLSITRHLRPSILAIDACANQSVVGIFESEKHKYSYIYPYLKNEIPRLMTLRSGAQQPHINKGTVDESLMIEPSSEILKEYYKKANSAYKQIINNSFQNQKLSKLRDWLLPMLMNGQVTIGEAEEKLGMVTEAGEKYGA